ncbi:hypothetical protein [uncultured Phascolarctobacterium sp.]|nr:hypothetical protein [uncultured Phascolarctobacterium sp.]
MVKTAKFLVMEKCFSKQHRQTDNTKLDSRASAKPNTEIKLSCKLSDPSKAKQDVQASASACTSCFCLYNNLHKIQLPTD